MEPTLSQAENEIIMEKIKEQVFGRSVRKTRNQGPVISGAHHWW